MENVKLLLIVTDGKDTIDKKNKSFNQAINLLKSKNIFSLSCGIGEIDVDHGGLTRLAESTGGKHIEIHHSTGIARAIEDLTRYIHTKILHLSKIVETPDEIFQNHIGLIQQNLVLIPIDLFILIDCSWSMLGMMSDGNWNGDKEKLSKAKEATINVVQSLNPNYDHVGVARFWEKYQCLTGLTSDFNKCVKLIGGIKGGGGTGLYRAICFVTEEFN